MASQVELKIPYIRSCNAECSKPLVGVINGEIPKWLNGNLVRVGSGLYQFEKDKLNHVFDGMSLMHRFEIKDGSVSYQSKFLRCDAYQKGMESGRLHWDAFATNASPDPCQTIFQRIASTFSEQKFTDNDNVNIIKYSDEYYATTESNLIWRINPETLETLDKVNLQDCVFVKGASAHGHEDCDGTVYNVGFHGGSKSGYAIIKFLPKEKPEDKVHDRASIVCNIPFTRKFYPCYFHSFGMTENYFIFVEQPLFWSYPKMFFRRFTGNTFEETINFDIKQKTRLYVVRRNDGMLLPTTYLAEKLFVFHHINAYEEDKHIIVDLCSYNDGNVIKSLYVDALRELYSQPNKKDWDHSYAKRYVLPLNEDNQATADNLVKLKDTQATAFRQKDGSIFCQPELLTDGDDYYPELPRINYEGYNGRKYRYLYAVAEHKNSQFFFDTLIKVDTKTKQTTIWRENEALPSEPVFVSNPGSSAEDEGVILASLLFANDDKKVSLLVLDAKTMTEIGRVDFKTESSVPATFHGIFVKNQ